MNLEDNEALKRAQAFTNILQSENKVYNEGDAISSELVVDQERCRRELQYECAAAICYELRLLTIAIKSHR